MKRKKSMIYVSLSLPASHPAKTFWASLGKKINGTWDSHDVYDKRFETLENHVHGTFEITQLIFCFLNSAFLICVIFFYTRIHTYTQHLNSFIFIRFLFSRFFFISLKLILFLKWNDYYLVFYWGTI